MTQDYIWKKLVANHKKFSSKYDLGHLWDIAGEMFKNDTHTWWRYIKDQ